MLSWKTRSRRLLLQHSSYLRVEEHAVELPDGRVIPNWPWIITPDFVNVLAETPEARFLCFRQVKYGVQGITLAAIGGYIEPGEAPLMAAQRELQEETGYHAEQWTHLGSFRVDANRGAGTGHLYLARHAVRKTTPDSDDLEAQELLLLSRSELRAALQAGKFKAMSWALLVALALEVLDRDKGNGASGIE